ncbi:MAG: hypothetical protein ACLRXC_13165 [[Clostridium] leptum]
MPNSACQNHNISVNEVLHKFVEVDEAGAVPAATAVDNARMSMPSGEPVVLV